MVGEPLIDYRFSDILVSQQAYIQNGLVVIRTEHRRTADVVAGKYRSTDPPSDSLSRSAGYERDTNSRPSTRLSI
jgi:hypothetical protein